MKDYQHTVLDRFLRYVKIDTQSDPHSGTAPSTEKQKDLGRMLVEELHAMGIADAELDPFGYVYATLPSNTEKSVPTICLCSHVDTSPETSGKDVKPVIHKNYDGRPIILPADNSIVIDPARHPELKTKEGKDIVTADGTTLLGADNKAGVAEIMDVMQYFLSHPDEKHGTVRVLFTTDEEIGHGVDHVDMKKLNADFGYTVDGEALGSFEDETFSADMVKVVIHGVNTHPGFAKDRMESALKAMAAFIHALPEDGLSPETTEGRAGFVHPYEITGGVERAEVTFIVRSFEDEKLTEYETFLEKKLVEAMKDYEHSSYEFLVTEQYRNMKQVVREHPQVSANALAAIKRTGITPRQGSIRGGTDGSRLSFMGLPCPNIFAGEHAFHSKMEWACVQDMEQAVETLVNLVKIWEENA